MQCPNCKTEIPDNTSICGNCGTKLSNTVQHPKMSSLAVCAFVLALIMPFLFFIAGVFETVDFVILASIPPVFTLLLVIVAMIRIRKSRGMLIGNGFAVAAIGILCLWIFMLIFRPRTKVYPLSLKQNNQLHGINKALDFYQRDLNSYPPSDVTDPNVRPYCGAMKLAEAMMGQDFVGFHPNSTFRSDGQDSSGKLLYDVGSPTIDHHLRKGPYLPIENANAYRLNEIFENTGPFDGNSYVLCDVFGRVTNLKTGKNIGMPILYYKADTSKTAHDINDPNNPDNIYNYKDNHVLLALGVPGQPDKKHPLFEDPTIFYKMTKDYKITKQNVPMRADSYILLSAGKDGLYGTKDDIVNFDMGWKPK